MGLVVPLASMGREEGELIFYVDFFFYSFPFFFSIWGPWGFLSSPHLVPWIVFVDSNL